MPLSWVTYLHQIGFKDIAYFFNITTTAITPSSRELSRSGPTAQIHLCQVSLIVKHILQRPLNVLDQGGELGEGLAVEEEDVEVPPVYRVQARVKEAVEDIDHGRVEL